jgi:hypothetical protein
VLADYPAGNNSTLTKTVDEIRPYRRFALDSGVCADIPDRRLRANFGRQKFFDGF